MISKSFTELVGCALPLQLAGMGRIGSSIDLPAAVSDGGGLGMIAAAGTPVDALSQTLREMSNATTGPFGVNFLMPFLDREAVTLASKHAPVVEFFYGSPDAPLIELVHEGGALASWQVGSLDESEAAVAAGCDFIVVQGTEAGGHVRGKQTLLELLESLLLSSIAVPVLAAGGIGAAEDVARAIAAGAAGVRVGTRFLAASESIAHPNYIDALIAATEDDTVLTEAFSIGWPNAPHRVLRSCIEVAEATTDEFVATMDFGEHELKVPRFAGPPPTNTTRGNIAAMALYAGTSVGAVRERKPAREIVAELCARL